MSQKLQPEKIESIQEHYANGMIGRDIATMHSISLPTVVKYTKGLQRVNPETEQRFESRIEYNRYLASQRVNPNPVQRGGVVYGSLHYYQQDWAQKKGYATFRQYEQELEQQRQEIPLNQIMSALIATGLDEIGEDQKWLADGMEVTESAVSRWASGKTLPRKSLQPTLFGLLQMSYQTVADIPYQTLDDFVFEENPITRSKF